MKRRLKKALSVVLAVSICASMLVVPSTAVTHKVPAETTSASQIVPEFATNSNSTNDGKVTITKSISATQMENVFDITLGVETTEAMVDVPKDSAVVLVVDTTESMFWDLSNKAYCSKCKGIKSECYDHDYEHYKYLRANRIDATNPRKNVGVQRFDLAAQALSKFVTDYAASGKDANGNKVASRYVSVVFFGHKAQIEQTWIDVSNATNQATVLSKLSYSNMTASGNVYRWTAHGKGLEKAGELLSSSPVAGNQYVVMLTDGQPTKIGDYSAAEKAYDVGNDGGNVSTCGSGCSATCQSHYGNDNDGEVASGMAAAFKSAHSGTTVHVVGLGTSTLSLYGSSSKYTGSSTNLNVNTWLKNYIASAPSNFKSIEAGSENAIDLGTSAYLNQLLSAAAPKAFTDEMGSAVEFLGFLPGGANTKANAPMKNELKKADDGDTASISAGAEGVPTIAWDMKNSTATESGAEGSKTYSYSLAYRVRLKNEMIKADGTPNFAEENPYTTNGTAALSYDTNKSLTVDSPKVKGYLGEFSFVKVDAETGAPLEGVAFNLYHDPDECHVCKNHTGYQMTAEKEIVKTATSDANGHVVFAGIPSGHSYTLEEVKYNNYELAAPIQVAVTYNNTYAGANYNMETELYESAPQAIPTGLGGKYETSTTGTFKQVANVHEVGTVKLTKLTDGTGARGWHRFPFTVKAIDAEGNIDMSVAGKKFGHVFFDAQTGIGSITMKAGETKTFSGLPAGITLLIEEVDIGKGYTTSHVVNPAESEYKKDGEEPKGEIVKVSVGAGAAVDVTFTNYRYDPARDELGLYASKTLVGGTLEADDFTFILEELGRFKWESKNNELGGVKFPIIIYTARQPGDFDNNYYSYDSVTNEYYKNEDVANSYYKLDDVTNDYYTFDPVAATHYYYSYEPVVDTISTHTYYIYEKVAGSSSTIFDTSAYKVQVDVKVGRNGDCKVDTESAVYTRFPTLEDAKAGTNGTVIQANQISFTNRKVYDLTVAKTISGNGANSQDEFPFRITLNDATINETFGGVVFTNGVGEFTLKGGQSKTFRDLPGGVGYTVTEVDSKGYTVTAADGEGAALTVTEGSVVGVLSDDETVTFDNYKKKDEEPPLKTNYYDLTVRKELSGNNTSTADVFSFQITLNDETINAKHGDVTFVGGKATFTLKGGESITAKGLPEGIVYTVTETDSGAGYEVEYSDNAKDATLSGDAIVTVTNSKSKDDKPELTKSATISVKKVWVLDDGAANPESVTVTLYRTDEENKTIPLETAVLNQSNDWSKTWTKTWTGEAEYTWSVDETDVPEGFTKTVTHEGNAYTITNNDKSSTTSGESDPDPDPEVIINDGDTPRDEMTLPDPELPREEMILPDPEVPKTGDVNLIMWLALAVLSGFGLLALLRKREEN